MMIFVFLLIFINFSMFYQNNSKTSQAQDWTLSFERVLQDPITSQNFAVSAILYIFIIISDVTYYKF